MKMAKTSFLMAAAMLAVPAAAAPITIDLTTTGATGAALDIGTALTDLPLTVDVAEDPDTLTISIISGSSFDSANSTVNAASGSFGINAPTPPVGSENAARFDVDAAETMQIAFNFDVYVIGIDLTSLTGDETFTVGSVTDIDDANTDGSDNYDFTDGGTSSGLFFAAGSGIVLEAGGPAGSSVGIEDITIEIVPEPSSIALLLAGGLMIARRRRG